MDNVSKTVRLVNREGIHVQSKKEYCISNNFEKLGPLKKAEAVAKYKEVGIAMVDLGSRIVFFSINDARFKVK